MLLRIDRLQQIYIRIICIDSLTLAAQSPSVGRDLVAVSTKHHATPTPMMRFGLVGEPEHARLVLAPCHQMKVGGRKQISSGFRHGPKYRLGGIFRLTFSIFSEPGLFQTSRG
jgi:hypothetical protein